MYFWLIFHSLECPKIFFVFYMKHMAKKNPSDRLYFRLLFQSLECPKFLFVFYMKYMISDMFSQAEYESEIRIVERIALTPVVLK